MIFDSHVHFGQFREKYYTSPHVLRFVQRAGIDRFAFSSTSAIVCDDPGFLKEERDTMLEMSEFRGIPLQWISFGMLRHSRDLSLYLDESVRGLKIHGVSEPWSPFGKRLQRVFAIAQERNIPILLHTGEYERAYAGNYEKICKKFSSVTVILAHGRPLDQTIRVLQKCPNTFVDTAFMPLHHLNKLLLAGFRDRILFGTDLPIPQLFHKDSLTRYIRYRIEKIRKIAGNDQERIFWNNASGIWLD